MINIVLITNSISFIVNNKRIRVNSTDERDWTIFKMSHGNFSNYIIINELNRCEEQLRSTGHQHSEPESDGKRAEGHQ